MSEKSRDEKLAAAKKKLKKFQEKEKDEKSKITDNSISNNQVCNLPNKSNLVPTESNEVPATDLSMFINRKNADYSTMNSEEPTVTTESLKHISRHLNGILSCSSSSIDRESQMEYLNTIRDLEKRNIELASLNSQKAEQMETLVVKISNLNEALDRVKKERDTDVANLESSHKRQIDSNKEQFQAQIHTIGLLVAEKSELQSQMTHNQKVAAQRQQENEDITNKLKSSRQKFGDLEKMLNEIKTKNDKLEEAYRDMSRQSDQMRNSLKKLKSEKDDCVSECSQLRSKLMSKTQEASNLELTLDDVKSHLEMSQVQIQHLTNSQEGHYDSVYSQLKLTENKNLELMQNLESAKLQIQQADSQSNRIQSQYRNYFEQMEEKLKNLQTDLSHVIDERSALSAELDSCKKRMSEINSEEDVDVCLLQNMVSNLQQKELKHIEKINDFQYLIKDLNDKNLSLSDNNAQLANINEELEEKNIELMEKNNQLEVNKIDQLDLLQQLQSDKTALSRALAQNKQLKSQLIELQEAFVKLSSDNMDLSTKLDHEKHVSRELSSRLGEQEDDLNEIRQMVGNRDEEISRLIQSNKQITEELLTTNNYSESSHLQRSDAHFNMANKELVTSLQIDVSHLQERINKLTSENNSLRCHTDHSTGDILPSYNNDISNDHGSSINVSLLQLQSERDELLVKCEAYNVRESELLRLLDNCQEATDENGVVVTRELYQSIQHSICETNDTICKVIESNTRLVEDNARLEHTVAQLEGETDTIGEYISLYQHQRSMLKQRSVAKDQFMSKLVHQQQLLDSRLSTLEQMIGDMSGAAGLDNSGRVHGDEHSSLSQIFELIQELRRPGESALLSSDGGPLELVRNKGHSEDSFASDHLFHSQFIHCKCCVGKIIDL